MTHRDCRNSRQCIKRSLVDARNGFTDVIYASLITFAADVSHHSAPDGRPLDDVGRFTTTKFPLAAPVPIVSVIDPPLPLPSPLPERIVTLPPSASAPHTVPVPASSGCTAT